MAGQLRPLLVAPFGGPGESAPPHLDDEALPVWGGHQQVRGQLAQCGLELNLVACAAEHVGGGQFGQRRAVEAGVVQHAEKLRRRARIQLGELFVDPGPQRCELGQGRVLPQQRLLVVGEHPELLSDRAHRRLIEGA